MVRVPRGALLVLLVLAASACSDDDTADPAVTTESTTTTVESTTTTDPPPDPSVIPDDPADIDEAYVEAVLAELMHVDGEVLRLAVRDGLGPQLRPLLEAINTLDELNVQLQLLAQDAAEDFAGYNAEPGDVVVEVDAILHVSSECISADTTLDFSAVGPDANPAVPTRVELRRSEVRAPENPTPWSFAMRRPQNSSTPLPEPCAT